jgi:hypothetical protein
MDNQALMIQTAPGFRLMVDIAIFVVSDKSEWWALVVGVAVVVVWGDLPPVILLGIFQRMTRIL